MLTFLVITCGLATLAVFFLAGCIFSAKLGANRYKKAEALHQAALRQARHAGYQQSQWDAQKCLDVWVRETAKATVDAT